MYVSVDFQNGPVLLSVILYNFTIPHGHPDNNRLMAYAQEADKWKMFSYLLKGLFMMNMGVGGRWMGRKKINITTTSPSQRQLHRLEQDLI